MKKTLSELTIVTIIRKKGNSILVQYVEEEILTRKFVPAEEVDGVFVATSVLAQGIPYGYPWEDAEMKFDSRKFANELHNLEVWTVQDALKSPQKLWSALRTALADNLSMMLEIAKNESKGVNRNG